MPADDETRDRVRALVRDVLQNALPEEDAPTDNPRQAAATPEAQTQSRFVNVAPEPPTGDETRPEFARDESSKSVITEDDVHGLEEGARLRIAEGARLTPLAADIVRERRIELVRRVPRRGSRASKMVAVGADHGGFKM